MSFWPYPYQKVTNPFVIPAGLLRNQVSIQSKDLTPNGQDEDGGELVTWDTALTCMAAILPIAQKENFETGASPQFVGQVTHRVSIYWPGASVAICGGMQVLFGSRTFVIQNPENVQERNRVLHLTCLEINGVQ